MLKINWIHSRFTILHFSIQALRCWTFRLEVEAKENSRSNRSGLLQSKLVAVIDAFWFIAFKRALRLCLITHLPSPPCRREEAALRLMLERREAELREAMKLRHSLTTLLHALRVDMEHVSKTREPFQLVTGPERRSSYTKWTYHFDETISLQGLFSSCSGAWKFIQTFILWTLKPPRTRLP